MDIQKTEKIAPDFKSVFIKTLSVLLCVASAIYFIFAVFIFSISVKTPPENTLEVFGYKIYCAQSDIQDTDVKPGALVVIKNTDDDEFYSPETLKSDALVIPGLGALIKNDIGIITFCMAVVFSLIYVIVFFSEIYRKISKAKHEEIDFDFPLDDEFESDQSQKEKSTGL